MAVHNEHGAEQGQLGTKLGDAFATAGLGTQSAPREAAAPQPAPLQSRALESRGPQSVNSRFFRSMGRVAVSQTVSEAKKVFEKIRAERQEQSANSPAQYLIESIDSSTQGVKIGALLYCAHFIDLTGTKTLLVMPLLLEGSVDRFPVRDITPRASYDANPMDRHQIVEQLVASDYAMSDGFIQAITNKLRATYGDFKVVVIGSITVPRLVNVAEDTKAVYDLLSAANAAIETVVFKNYLGEQPLTVLDASKDAATSVVMDHGSQAAQGDDGLPQRRDITLTLRATERSQIPGEPEEVTDLVAVSGYVDLYYREPDAPTNLNQRADTRRFVPVFVVNAMNSVKWNLVTMESKLLALAIAPMLATNDQYKAPFMARATQGDPNHDAGALGYVVNFSGDENGQPQGKEDMSVMSTKEQLELLRMSIFPELHVALAVQRTGTTSWIDGAFYDAASNSTEATKAIIASADALTGGVFSKRWNNNPAPLFTLLPGGKLFGYYSEGDSKNRELRDLADLDALWALNQFGDSTAPDQIWNFFETFLLSGNSRIQMAERWKIISSRYPSATLVDVGALVEPSPEFLECLTESVISAGLDLRSGTMLQDFSGARGRASFGSGRGINGQAIASTMNRGMGADTRSRGAGFTMGTSRGYTNR